MVHIQSSLFKCQGKEGPTQSSLFKYQGKEGLNQSSLLNVKERKCLLSCLYSNVKKMKGLLSLYRNVNERRFILNRLYSNVIEMKCLLSLQGKERKSLLSRLHLIVTERKGPLSQCLKKGFYSIYISVSRKNESFAQTINVNEGPFCQNISERILSLRKISRKGPSA